MTVRVKICGLTSLADALAAVAAGADALGFVLAPSPRRLEPRAVRAICRELPPLVGRVGVFVDQPPEEVARLREFCGLDWVQLHGREGPEQAAALGWRVIKAMAVGGAPPRPPEGFERAGLLLDTRAPGRRGGTGLTFDWALARPLAAARPVILAGGLGPGNVAEAVRAARPFAVDVSSGVESAPGRKDHAKLSEFVRRAKQA